MNAQPPMNNATPLGHSVYLSLDSSADNFPVYSGLVSSYKWMEKAHDYSAGAVTLLSQNSLNRSVAKVSMVRNRRGRNNALLQTAAQPGALEAAVAK